MFFQNWLSDSIDMTVYQEIVLWSKIVNVGPLVYAQQTHARTFVIVIHDILYQETITMQSKDNPQRGASIIV